VISTHMKHYGMNLEKWIDVSSQQERLESFPYILLHTLMAFCLFEKYLITQGDIKPTNIIWNSQLKKATIIDFGGVWFECFGKNNNNYRCANHYKAPEVQASQPYAYHYSIFSDLYSLGITLIELLLGDHETKTPIEDFHNQIKDDENINWWNDILLNMIKPNYKERCLPTTLISNCNLQKWTKLNTSIDYQVILHNFSDNNNNNLFLLLHSDSINFISNYFYINQCQLLQETRLHLIRHLYQIIILNDTTNKMQFSFIITLFDKYLIQQKPYLQSSSYFTTTIITTIFLACFMIIDALLDDGCLNHSKLSKQFKYYNISKESILECAIVILRYFNWNVMQNTIDLYLIKSNIYSYFQQYKQNSKNAIYNNNNNNNIDYNKIYRIYSDPIYMYLNFEQLILRYYNI